MRNIAKRLLLILVLLQVVVFSFNTLVIFSMQEKPTGASLGYVKLEVMEAPSDGGAHRPELCIEYWACEDWEPETCPSNGLQRRVCIDINKCGTVLYKPLEIRQCLMLQCYVDEDCPVGFGCENNICVETLELIELPSEVPPIIEIAAPAPPVRYFLNQKVFNLFLFDKLNLYYEERETPLGLWTKEVLIDLVEWLKEIF